MDSGIPHKELRRFLDHPKPSVPHPALPSIWNKVTKLGLAFIHTLFAILKPQWCKNSEMMRCCQNSVAPTGKKKRTIFYRNEILHWLQTNRGQSPSKHTYVSHQVLDGTPVLVRFTFRRVLLINWTQLFWLIGHHILKERKNKPTTNLECFFL